MTVSEILAHASKEFDRIGDDLISQIPLKDIAGVFGHQQAIVAQMQDFLSKYPDLIAARSNEIVEELDSNNHAHEISTIKEGLILLGREKIEYYRDEYFNKPLDGKSS